MSDKVVVMSDGMIQQIGTPEEIYNEPNTVFVADFIGESNIFNGKMSGRREVRFCGAEFPCLDDLPVGSDVDVVVRPEDIEMTAAAQGQLTGTVRSAIFKGMHYEITVESGDNEIVVRSTKLAAMGETLGLRIEPDGIHVIPSDTTINLYDGVITALNKVAFAEGEFDCDVTKLYPGSRIENNGLLDRDGKKIGVIGTDVRVKIPAAAVTMSDELEAGTVTGHIISLIYKGDHYHYIVRTKNGADIHLHDQDLWNEGDHVSIAVPAESIQLSLKTTEE